MTDEFSIPDLLSLLQVDRTHTAIQLSLEADRLCRLRQYKPAIDVAESATRLVPTDPWLLGQTLLYLSYARLCSDLPEQVLQAKRDCDRAIRALGLSTYNYAVANMIRGQMELRFHGETGRSNTLRYFQRASEALEKLRVEETRYNRPSRAEKCLDLRTQIDQQVKQLMQAMTDTPEDKIPPKQYPPESTVSHPTRKSKVAAPGSKKKPAKVSPSDNLILQHMVWPPAQPPLVIDAPPGMTGLMPDFLGVGQLSVQNRLYDVTPLIGNGPVHLRPQQNYWIAPLEGATHGELALVREQVRPDRAEQFVVIKEPTGPNARIDKAERIWHIHDSIEQLTNLPEPRIIGIVEAVLIPVDDKTT